MNSNQIEDPPNALTPMSSLAFGVFLIVLSGGILYFSSDIKTFDFGNNDPGPKAIPIATGIIMLLGGVFQISMSITKENLFQHFSKSSETSPGKEQTSTKRIALVFFALVVYVGSLSLIGFIVSTMLFLIAILKLLESRWLEAFISSVVIVAFVYVLFQSVFQVSLPSGSLF